MKHSLRALAVLGALALAGCASTGGQDTDSLDAGPTSRYADQKTGEAAADSDAYHIPPVPHDPAVEKVAKEAMGEYARALKALVQGEQQRALVMFQSLGERYPKLSGPRVNEGLIHLSRKAFDKAQAAFEKALAANSSNPYAHNGLGVTLREQGKFQQAQAAYQQALALDPKYARAHFNLAVLSELYLQDYALALDHFRAYQDLQKEPDTNVANWIVDLERRVPDSVAEPDDDAQPLASTQGMN